MNCMKTNNRWARQRGTTLIELSVVIAVILLLVGVLFIGITAWRDGANKAACIVNIATIQKAMRGYQNMNNLLPTTGAVTQTLLTSANFWASAPVCPAGGSYTWGTVVPVQGTAFVTCSITGHAPSSTQLANW
jgi:prepilin-type N-terminal cleavage/methylation domain-containing protein